MMPFYGTKWITKDASDGYDIQNWVWNETNVCQSIFIAVLVESKKKIIIKFYNFYDWLILIKRPQKALNKWNSIPNGNTKQNDHMEKVY